MKKKSESLLTLETDRNENFEEATQKEPSSHMPSSMLSQFSATESYENAKISDITETEQDDSVQVSLTKLNELILLNSLMKKMSEMVGGEYILTYNVNYSDDSCKNSTKYASNDFSKKNDFLNLDIRNMSPYKKFSGFVLNMNGFNLDDHKKIIYNISKSARPVCRGIVINAKKEAISYFKKNSFDLIESDHNNNLFYFEKNELNKVSSAEIFDKKTNKSKAYFVCDNAESFDDKIAGLQAYNELKYGSGLVFPYDKPQDVLYHMGTVSFPIDIMFVGEDKKIKKICENIAPGSLATFGASNVKWVVEISGGASKELGVVAGDKINISGISNKEFLKASSIKEYFSNGPSYFRKISSDSSFLKSKNFSVINTDQYFRLPSIKKFASSFEEKRNTAIFDFDKLIFSEKSSVRLFKKNNSGHTVMPAKEFITLAGSIKDHFIIPNKLGSFNNFLLDYNNTDPVARKMFFQLVKSAKDNDKIVFVTRYPENNDVYRNLILKRAEEEIIVPENLWSSQVMVISNNLSPEEIIAAASKNFGGDSFKYISSEDMVKTSGIPIPSHVKSESRKAYANLKEVKDDLSELSDNFNKNKDELNKLSAKPGEIKSYNGVYHQSCKRNAKKIFSMLEKLKASLKIMNEIKDISSVSEKIDAVILSSTQYVSLAEEIFSLVSKMDNGEEFLKSLVELTESIDKSKEDFENNIDNFIEYIAKNILNEKILTS